MNKNNVMVLVALMTSSVGFLFSVSTPPRPKPELTNAARRDEERRTLKNLDKNRKKAHDQEKARRPRQNITGAVPSQLTFV